MRTISVVLLIGALVGGAATHGYAQSVAGRANSGELRSGDRTLTSGEYYDELVFEAPKGEADALCKLAKDVMEAAPEPAAILSVPLTVEAKAGATWGAAH